MYSIEIGDVFAERYRIEAELGHGGMGSVYRAIQLALNRQVALKVIAPQFSKNAVFCELFDREANTMAMLNHPNIVAIIDRSPPTPVKTPTVPLGGPPPASGPATSSASSIRWLALQFVDGSNVTGLVKKLPAPARLPAEHAARIIHDVLLGLEYAHGKSVVHQDIKPDNIFLAKDTGQVLIGDFGLAKVRAGTVTASLLKGTPNYTAPELMQGVAPSPQSDLWSVGVMFWELLTGQLLYGGSSFEECFYSITTLELAPLSSFGVAVAPGIEHVIRRLLTKPRGERYASASDALRDLTPFIAELQPFRRFIRSTFGIAEATAPTVHAGSLPVAVPATTGGLAAGQFASVPRGGTQPARKRGRGVALGVAAGALVAGAVAAVVVHNGGGGAPLGGTESRPATSAAPPIAAAPSSAPPAPPPPAPAMAIVTIEVTPTDAVVTVDGKSIDGAASRKLQGIALHQRLTLHVERAGYQPYDGTIAVESTDVLVPVQLTAVPTPPPVRAATPAARTSSRPDGPLIITPGGDHHRKDGPSVLTPK